MSSPSSSLVETQPLDSSQPSTSPPMPTDVPWGWLVNLKLRGLNSSLSSHAEHTLSPVMVETFKVGRDLSCNKIIDETMFIGSTEEDLQIVKVSRVQFQLNKEGNNVALVDKSMNGTYVNGFKVGKDKQHGLEHGDVIAILKFNYDVFLFISEGRLRQIFPRSVIDKYLVGRVLGEGASAVVKEAYARDTNEKVALKIIKKEKWPSKYSEPCDLSREAEIAAQLDHPCIVKVLGVFDEKDMFVIAMEYASGGELFDQVMNEADANLLTESMAKQRFYQISHAIAYLHTKKVCHRDLKLENILMIESSSTSLLKITDFGLSKNFDSIDVLETFVGTPVYMAPEVISLSGKLYDSHSYNEKSDCWSLGVVLYMLLSGVQPFRESSSVGLQNIIMAGKFDPMKGGRWAAVSEVAKDLVRKLLVVDPNVRLGAEEILGHEWFQRDKLVVRRAEVLMGLEKSEADSGRGSIADADGESVQENKRKRDEEPKIEELRLGKKRVFTEEAMS